MNFWLVAGVAILFVLVGVVLFGTRRPRRAEDELRQSSSRPAPTAKAGSLTHGSFTDVIQSIRVRRLTGTLRVTSGERTACLYFLFGHLFHAANLTLTGEAAVRDCLGWQDADYAFDREAQLPTAETITRPIDQILAALGAGEPQPQ